MATSPRSRSRFSWSRFLIGKPLATDALPHQTVSRPVGLAVFASDALSSTAYATEEILIILALAGTGAATLGLSIPIAIAIAVLLVIVTISYRQTIYAYPNGGGAYIVARDNLGEMPAKIAAAALLTDYILTVAVSISAGVAQITSGIPDLLPYRVEIAVAVIGLVTVINLRGVRESGRIFAIPTYFFLAIMGLTLVVGTIRWATGSLNSVGEVELVRHDVQALTLFLVLRAFSSGCTALTGIEAISNGVQAFQEPRSRNAAVTLVWMGGLLIVLFLGITLVAHWAGVLPSEEQTAISQIGRAVFGEGSPFYVLVLVGTALILLMAANTSYAGFPRLAALAASDGFLPRQLALRGSRLVFSWGIIGLAALASLLVIGWNARTTALIPLYAIGVFLSFTISQSGMVVHLRRIGQLKPGTQLQGREAMLEYDPRWHFKMVISAVGAVATGLVMVIFAVTKFTSGAWIVVVLIPLLVYIFTRIHRHYQSVAEALSLSARPADTAVHRIQTLILVDDVHAETARLVSFAKSLGHPWRAIHVATNPDKVVSVQEKWAARVGEGELIILPSPYRFLAEPIRQYIQDLLDEDSDAFVHLIMGHLVMDSFWEQVMHQNTAYVFNLLLGRIDRVVMTSVPYQIYTD